MIRTVRLERNLTQEELGKLVGVQRAQISKLESNTTNVTVEIILKVFGALKARVFNAFTKVIAKIIILIKNSNGSLEKNLGKS